MTPKIFFLILTSLPRSIYFNFRCLPFLQAIRIPILIHWNTALMRLKRNSIRIEGPVKPFMIKLGLGGSYKIASRRCVIESIGDMVFTGRCILGRGLLLSNKGHLRFGKDGNTQPNTTIWCDDHIEIGDDFLFAADVTVRDNDGHTMIADGKDQPTMGKIRIGDHVWLCPHTVVLKNSSVPAGSVTAYGTIVTKPFEEENVLLAGIPAKIVKHGSTWKR